MVFPSIVVPTGATYTVTLDTGGATFIRGQYPNITIAPSALDSSGKPYLITLTLKDDTPGSEARITKI